MCTSGLSVSGFLALGLIVIAKTTVECLQPRRTSGHLGGDIASVGDDRCPCESNELCKAISHQRDHEVWPTTAHVAFGSESSYLLITEINIMV